MEPEARSRNEPHNRASVTVQTLTNLLRSATDRTRFVGARVLGGAALAGVLAVSMAACTAGPVAPEPSASTTTKPAPAAGLPTLEPGPPPEFAPDGTAAENLPFFDYTTIMVILGGDDIGGPEIIDGLAAAGFDKSQMQVSRDTTPTGLQADSIQFSVLFHDECLIGQWGASTGFHSMIAPPLATEQCLVGSTRPIDW